MIVSILDQSPVLEGSSQAKALEESKKLALLGEELGYKRYWIAEHHDMKGLSCSSPEVMISYIGASTKKIRLGAGAVLLPHYKPYKVAETYHMLETLFPGRIDIGIGRAPGGSAEASMALSGNYLDNVKKFPDLLDELLHFLRNDFPEDHLYSSLKASPVPPSKPQPWLLGTNNKSALLAAEHKLPYVFGHFMSDADANECINTYKTNNTAKPYVILTVAVICGETTEEAEEMALSYWLWKEKMEKGEKLQGVPSIMKAKEYFSGRADKRSEGRENEKVIIGSPEEAGKKISELQQQVKADEIMVVTITPTYEMRSNSYKAIAKALL
ncbi:LLM class flavin-dependent oxidoreductase [Bacillus sp. FJAT-44742]|uniref:LLM class flavin-dependent oxidoreductase n=1 Tax=Bacillus sp. FJAT-44742 TaxID=2014005 RepID=UPI000C231064|nr:LLM class flavin-dependent oxidoreductase [Bacillus sp. FJAT-44742]